MNLSLSDEQEFLREAARGALEEAESALRTLDEGRLAAEQRVQAAREAMDQARLAAQETHVRRAALALLRDASRHRSPNAGWPEAAMAGALDLKLAGPRVYGETLIEDTFMGEGRREADPADIRRALRLYWRACAIQAVALAVAAVVWG